MSLSLAFEQRSAHGEKVEENIMKLCKLSQWAIRVLIPIFTASLSS